MSWLPINQALIRNPYNWLVVVLMVVFVGLALHVVFAPMSLPTTDGTQP
jgi:hypothetical protein